MPKRKLASLRVKFKFHDLDEDVIEAIISKLNHREIVAYERICRKVGRCCKSLWKQLKKFPSDCRREDLLKMMTKCPNLSVMKGLYIRGRYYNEDCYKEEWLTLWADMPSTFPKIERFQDVPLDVIFQYAQALGQRNRIKSIKVFIRDTIDYTTLEKMNGSDFELFQLKTLTLGLTYYKAFEIPLLVEIIKKLLHRAEECIWHHKWYTNIDPGAKLLALTNHKHEHNIPDDFPIKHPKFRSFDYMIEGSTQNMRILNRMPFLTGIQIKFMFRPKDLNSIRSLFQRFLEEHLYLKEIHLVIDIYLRNYIRELMTDIMTIRPDLRKITIDGNCHYEILPFVAVDWNLVMNMRNLRHLDLRIKIHNNIEDTEVFYRTLSKLRVLRIRFPTNEDEFQEETDQYFKAHPERSKIALNYY